MDVEALKDEKELVSARIDEIEVLLISARGGNKVARLVAELDELEAKKEVLKQQIASVPVKPSVIAASPPTTVRPVQPTAAAPAAIVEPATKNAPKKKKGKKQIGGAVVGDAGDLQALENEVAELERVAEQKEEEEQKARFAMANFRLELSSREASVWEREQRLLKASVEQEPLVKHAVRLQRIFRRREEKKIRGDAKLKGIVKQYLKSSEAKQGREKWSALMTFCAMQESYARGLIVVRDKYVSPMRKTNHTVSGATREDIEAMFGLIETLAFFEADIAAALRQRLFSRFHHPSIGDVVLRMCAVFPVYVEYGRSLENVFAVMSRLQKGGLFGSYLEKLHAVSDCSLSITALLELPRSHLAQVTEQLARLVRLTEADHCDLDRLEAASNAAEEAQRELTGLEQERKERINLVAATRRIAGLPDVVLLPGQKLLHEQDVLLVEKKRLPYRIFLFADCVVLAAGAANSKTFKYVEMLSLGGTRFNSLSDNDSTFNSFELQTMSRVWQFVCDTFDAKQRLEAAFAKAIVDINSSLADAHRSNSMSHISSAPFSSSASSFHLNGLRLESEVRVAKDEAARSSLSFDQQCSENSAALARALQSASVLQQLDHDAMGLCVQLLDAHGVVTAALTGAVKELMKREPGQNSLFAALAAPDATVATLACCAAAVLGARPWIAALLSDRLAEIRKKKAPAEVAAALVADLSSGKATRDLPLLIRVFVATLRAAAQKKLRVTGGADGAAVVFFGASFVVAPLRWPAKFGIDVETPSSYLEAFYAAFAKEAIAPNSPLRVALMSACANPSPLSVTVSMERSNAQVVPALILQLQQNIERLPAEVIKPLARCIVNTN